MSGIRTFMHAIRIQESGDNYRARNATSGAGGAYQFMPGTWRYALTLAGLSGISWAHKPVYDAPPNIQDAAAYALMTVYYNQFGRNWYNVAEAWYGGPGAVGHPSWGGGPGYPNVGQYAASVMRIYYSLSGTGAEGPPQGLGNLHDIKTYKDLVSAWNFMRWVDGPSIDGYRNRIISTSRW